MGFYGIILLAISLSIDSIGIGLGCGMSGVKIRKSSRIIICSISSFITAASLFLGNIIWGFFSGDLLIYISGFLLIAMGIFIMAQGIIKSKDNHTTVNIMRNPDSCDIDNSKSIDVKEAVITAIAFSADSVGIGICSAVYGIDIITITLFTFAFIYLFITSGLFIGRKCSLRLGISPKLSVIVSGVIIVGIGLFKLL